MHLIKQFILIGALLGFIWHTSGQALTCMQNTATDRVLYCAPNETYPNYVPASDPSLCAGIPYDCTCSANKTGCANGWMPNDCGVPLSTCATPCCICSKYDDTTSYVREYPNCYQCSVNVCRLIKTGSYTNVTTVNYTKGTKATTGLKNQWVMYSGTCDSLI